MGKAVATQHPAVVLRSHYKLVRALLAIAMVAVIGLSVAVVILATEGDEVTTSQAPVSTPAEALGPSAIHAPGQRYDGGPEEGTRGIRQSDSAAPVHVNPSTGYASTRPEVAPPPSSIAAPAGDAYTELRSASKTRYDGGPDEGTRGPGR
jgi:hypothetical protein